MSRTALLRIGLSIAWMLSTSIDGAAATSEPARERIATDSPRATVLGNTFIAPAGWTLFMQGAGTILEAPGAVILTNGNPGWLIPTAFRRKLLEVLFDGRPEADDQVVAGATAYYDHLAAERKLIDVPADAAEASKLAARYAHPAIGEIVVIRKGAATAFDFGEWSSEMASRTNPNGTISFITVVPGLIGLEFVAGNRTLTLRDAQHEYVLAAK